MPKKPWVSAGLLMYRRTTGVLEVFLVHPGGPFWKNKHEGAWDLPKGEQHDDEDLFETAKREFSEETGIALRPDISYQEIGFITNKNGKVVHIWAFEDGQFDPAKMTSNTFQLEWPPKSGKIQEFPENDRGDYFELEEANKLIFPSLQPFLERLKQKLTS